jgi:Ca-activated chloride channel family protein
MELFRYQKYFFIETSAFIMLIFIYIQLIVRKNKITQMIFDENILNNILPQNIKNLRRTRDIIFFTSIFFAVISSSGPQWGIEYSEKPSYLANISIVVDTSLSMSAKDIKPSRLESVKLSIKSVIEKLSGYRLSLIAFQDKAYLQCPLTDDTDAINYFIDILQPDMLPYPGTNIADAIGTSIDYLLSYNGKSYVIIFTDGEDHSNAIEDAIKKAENSKVKFITVGIGTPQGDILYDEESKSYKKDRTGKTIISKLDESLLIKIAEKTNGKYIKYTTPEFVASEIEKSLDKSENSNGKEKTQSYHNRYQYFLIITFVLFLIEFIIMEAKPRGFNKLLYLMPLFIFLNVGLNAQISSEFTAEKGNRSYNKKDYQRAKEFYEKASSKTPTNEKFKFNLGNSLYKLEKYDDAIEKYSEIKDTKIQSKVLYNIGNSYYRKQDIEKAKEFYKRAILKDTSNEDAKFNLELLLKKKQSQAKNNDKKNNKNNQEQNKKNNDDKDKQDNQDKEKQKDKEKDESKRERQKQAEQFLDMMKNQEKQNLKNLQSKPVNQGAFKNEFDW